MARLRADADLEANHSCPTWECPRPKHRHQVALKFLDEHVPISMSCLLIAETSTGVFWVQWRETADAVHTPLSGWSASPHQRVEMGRDSALRETGRLAFSL